MDTVSNRVIKGYEIRDRVGAGGFGVVYRAFQPVVGREVAVKVILPQFANHPDFIRRFEAEAQFVARLEHPHIVPLYDYWREPDSAFLVMRWLPGSLRSMLQQGIRPLEVTSGILDQIASALSVAHRRGVIHRDIKPDNILLDEDGNAYLSDFGIAKDLSARSMTQADLVVGSPMYLTPEQIRNDPVAPQTDIYSLGIVLYELLTGEIPFPDATPTSMLAKHLNESVPPLHERRPDLPETFDAIIQKATAKDPPQRYQDALKLAAAFRAEVAHLMPDQSQFAPLAERETEIVGLIAQGLSDQEIAEQLNLSVSTVGWYIRQIYTKLEVHSRAQLLERVRDLQLLSGDGRGRRADELPVLQDDATVVEGLLPQFNLATPAPENPYKGLRAFQEVDAADFYGREDLVERLLTRLDESLDGVHFLAVIGPSGSGKSSVVKAGLIPALRRGALPGSERWFFAEAGPGTHPLEELEAALLRVAVQPLPSLLSQLREDTRGLVRAVKRILPGDDSELVLVIDQFEEIFTLVTDEDIRAHFLDSLIEAATDPRSRINIVITLRADFYDRPLQYRGLAELIQQRAEVVLPLTAEKLEEVIVKPAQRVGIGLEPDLLAMIVQDVSEQPGSLPLLQYALTELFDRRQSHMLTVEAYRASGGVLGALARRADELYENLEAKGQEATRQLLLRLVTLGERAEDTRRRVLRTELVSVADHGPVMEEVIEAYSQYRLLTLDRDPVTRGPTVEIAHEALLRSWGRLRGWVEESREDLRQQRLLAAAAAEWVTAERDPSFLLTGTRLAQFEEWAHANTIALTREEREYLEASIAEREAKQALEAERRAQEEALRRRATNRLRALLVLAVFLAVAVGLSLLAFNQATLAERRADEARNLTLALAAHEALNDGNADLALALALQAIDEIDPPLAQTQRILAEVAYAPGPERRLLGHDGEVSSIAVSPDGLTALSGSDDATLILWDLEKGEPIRRFEGHEGRVTRVAISPDGRTGLSGAEDGMVIAWNLETGETRRFPGQEEGVRAVAFGPGGRIVLSAAADATVIVWDFETGEETRRFQPAEEDIRVADFSPDRRSVLFGSDTTTVGLWDIDTGEEIRRFEGHNDDVRSVAFSPDGQRIASGSDDLTVRLWDIETGRELQQFHGHTEEVVSLAFSPDGETLLSGSEDRSVRLWHFETGLQIVHFQGHVDTVQAVAYTPEGNEILTAGDDFTVIVWNIAPAAQVHLLDGHTDDVYSVAISPDGKTALSASSDDTVRLWDLDTGAELHRLVGHTGNVYSVALSPDGQTGVSAGSDQLLIVWDLDTGRELHRLEGHTARVRAAALSPDGRTAVSSSDDETLILWDVGTGDLIGRLEENIADMYTVAFSPDGQRVAVGSDSSVLLFDVTSGAEIVRFEGHADLVENIAFSPDGHSILSGSDDQTVRLWNTETGEEIRRFQGHTDEVKGVAFSADGRRIASASNDATVRLWDVRTGEELRRFRGHIGDVNSVAFSPDGRSLLSGSDDGTVRLWQIHSLGELIEWVQTNRYVRDLSCAERELYRVEPLCDAN